MTSVLRAFLVSCLLGLVLAGCQSGPTYISSNDPLPAPVVVADGSAERRALNEQVYDAVVDRVEREFYRSDFGGVDWPAVAAEARAEAVAEPTEHGFYDRMNAVLSSLGDLHTNAVSASQRARSFQIENDGNYASYGLSLRRVSDVWYVIAVRPDGPAGEAGVQIGWRVISIQGLPYGRAAPIQAGRTDAVVFLDDDGREREVALTGRVLPALARRQVERLDGDVLLIRFDDFDDPSADWVLARLNEAVLERPRGVVLDLRNNDGGQISAMQRIASGLITQEMDATIQVGRFLDRRYVAEPADNPWAGPLIVLTGNGSASAAEVLAAALQESGRAIVVGDRSAGLVVASRHTNLPDGGRLSVGFAALRTAGGVELEGRGVEPDVRIIPTLAQRRADEDVVLEAARTRLAGS